MKWGGDSPSRTVSHPSYKGGTGPVPCPAYFTPPLLEGFDRVVYSCWGGYACTLPSSPESLGAYLQ